MKKNNNIWRFWDLTNCFVDSIHHFPSMICFGDRMAIFTYKGWIGVAEDEKEPHLFNIDFKEACLWVSKANNPNKVENNWNLHKICEYIKIIYEYSLYEHSL